MKHRLFIGIGLPADLQTQVTAVQNRLEKLNFPVEWERPEKLHLTLNFLGEVHDELIQKVIRVANDIVSAHQKFSLSPQYLETLYRRHEPTILYYGMSGDIQPLKDVQKDLTRAFNDLKLPQAERFLPHISIGKLKRTEPTYTKQVIDKISNLDMPPLSEFEVATITLYKSLVSNKGSHFERICDFLLQ